MAAITRTHCRAGAFTQIAQGVQSVRLHRHGSGALAIGRDRPPADYPHFLTFAKIDTVELHALGGVNVFWKPEGGADDVVEVIGG